MGKEIMKYVHVGVLHNNENRMTTSNSMDESHLLAGKRMIPFMQYLNRGHGDWEGAYLGPLGVLLMLCFLLG